VKERPVERVATTIKIMAKGWGLMYEFTEAVRPGDTMEVDVELPLAIEANGKVLGFLHNGRKYLVTEVRE
jgi:hypothetical protein